MYRSCFYDKLKTKHRPPVNWKEDYQTTGFLPECRAQMMKEKYHFYLWPILKFNIKIKFTLKCIRIGLITVLTLVTASVLKVHGTAYNQTA